MTEDREHKHAPVDVQVVSSDSKKAEESPECNAGGSGSDPELRSVLLWMMVAAGVSILLSALFYGLNFGPNVSKSQAIWGNFGDYFGGILGPLLSFFALIGLVITVSLQNKQLTYSRKALEVSQLELSLTRAELSKSALAQEQVARLAAQQSLYIVFSAKVGALGEAFKVACSLVENNGPYSNSAQYQLAVREKEKLAGQILSLMEELGSFGNSTNR